MLGNDYRPVYGRLDRSRKHLDPKLDPRETWTTRAGWQNTASAFLSEWPVKSSLLIFRISRQTCASQHGNVVSRENGHAVPGALPLPDCFVTKSPKSIHGKGFLLCLELLETHHFRFSFGQPSQEVVEPLIDVVNVEGGDSQQVPIRGSSSLPRSLP